LKFCKQIHSLIWNAGLSHQRRYNYDETGFKFKKHPLKSLLQKEIAPGYKGSNQYVLIFTFYNISGNHKLQLFPPENPGNSVTD